MSSASPRREKPAGDAADDAAARGLVLNVHSALRRDQVMRARDIDRPDAEELAQAEAEVRIVRRGWKPPRR